MDSSSVSRVSFGGVFSWSASGSRSSPPSPFLITRGPRSCAVSSLFDYVRKQRLREVVVRFDERFVSCFARNLLWLISHVAGPAWSRSGKTVETLRKAIIYFPMVRGASERPLPVLVEAKIGSFLCGSPAEKEKSHRAPPYVRRGLF